MRSATFAAQLGQNFIGGDCRPRGRRCQAAVYSRFAAGMVELADAADSKSADRKVMRVRLPPSGTRSFDARSATFSGVRASKRPMTRICGHRAAGRIGRRRPGRRRARPSRPSITRPRVAVYTLLRRLVRRPAIAEELLQETFVDVLEHIGAYEGRCPLPAWIRAHRGQSRADVPALALASRASNGSTRIRAARTGCRRRARPCGATRRRRSSAR